MDDVDEYLEKKKKGNIIPKNFTSKIKPVHIILIVGLIFFADQYIRRDGVSKWVLIAVALIVGLYLYSLRETPEGKPIPRNIAQEMARRDLILETNPYRSYSHGTKIIPAGYFKDQTWNSGDGPKLFKYNISFRVEEPGKAPKHIIYQMHPYTGECKGIVDSVAGFTGEDIKDIQLVFPEKIVKEEKPSN